MFPIQYVMKNRALQQLRFVRPAMFAVIRDTASGVLTAGITDRTRPTISVALSFVQ